MEYFMGETFDKEKNKPYKKLDAAEKAAEKVKAAVFDENGEVVKDFREKVETPAEPPQTATDGSQEQRQPTAQIRPIRRRRPMQKPIRQIRNSSRQQ